MTTERFGEMALDYDGASESSHMKHPDFRIMGKVFATLGYPDEKWGMVKLNPEQQLRLVADFPRVFKPCAGSWGKRGNTNVLLSSAREEIVRAALDLAVGNLNHPPKPVKRGP